MNETIIENMNRFIKPEDTLYFLGDFLFGMDKMVNFKLFWSRLNVRSKFFIRGNHEDYLDKNNNKSEAEEIVGKIYDTLEVNIGGNDFWLCHYNPEEYYSRPNAHKISHTGEGRKEDYSDSKFIRKSNKIYLWGHEHSGKPDNPELLGLEIGIDTSWYGHKKYTPYNLDEIIHLMKTYKGY